ncbi:MAG TPA: hypothetical protein VGD56_22595, partial [Gemmatirosa sp.]
MSAIVAPSAPALRTRTASDRTFFLSVAVAAALLIFVGFSRSYYLKTAFPLAPPLSLLVHVHGAVFTAWVLYFVLQTGLIAVHRPAVHRRLGVLGAALGAAVIVLGLAVTFMAIRLNRGTPSLDPETQFLVALVDIVTFSIFFVAGWLQRRNRAAHQRLMLLAVVAGMLSAPLGRIVGYGVSHPVVGLVNLAFILAGPVYDVVTRRRIHPVYVYGCLFALVTLPPLRFVVGASPWWHRVAHTLAGLPTATRANTTAGMAGARPTSSDERTFQQVRQPRTRLDGERPALAMAIRPAPLPRVTRAVRALAGCYRLRPASA